MRISFSRGTIISYFFLATVAVSHAFVFWIPVWKNKSVLRYHPKKGWSQVGGGEGGGLIKSRKPQHFFNSFAPSHHHHRPHHFHQPSFQGLSHRHHNQHHWPVFRPKVHAHHKINHYKSNDWKPAKSLYNLNGHHSLCPLCHIARKPFHGHHKHGRHRHGFRHGHGHHGNFHGSGHHGNFHGSGHQGHFHGPRHHGHLHGSGHHGHGHLHGSGHYGHGHFRGSRHLHGPGHQGHLHGSGHHGHIHGPGFSHHHPPKHIAKHFSPPPNSFFKFPKINHIPIFHPNFIPKVNFPGAHHFPEFNSFPQPPFPKSSPSRFVRHNVPHPPPQHHPHNRHRPHHSPKPHPYPRPPFQQVSASNIRDNRPPQINNSPSTQPEFPKDFSNFSFNGFGSGKKGQGWGGWDW